MNTMLSRIGASLAAIDTNGLYPNERIINGPSTEREIFVDGRKMINFSSNSYLNLSRDKAVLAAARVALNKYGSGSGASRLTGGNLAVHRDLEAAVAAYKGTEDAVVFSAGFMANSGLLQALLSSHLAALERRLTPLAKPVTAEIFSDTLNHASIADGIALAIGNSNGRVKATRYNHCNAEHLEKLLKRSTADEKLIVTDGVFSLHGHIAPLGKIVELAHRYEALTYVDDAHATGILGDTGRGTAEHCGVEGEVDFTVGTFSKAIGQAGGFIASSAVVCRYLRVACKTYVFQTSMPPTQAAGIIAALKILTEKNDRRHVLRANSDYLRRNLERLGCDTLGSETHIIPVLIGDERLAKEAQKRLETECGIFAPGYYYPAVPRGNAIIRFNVMTEHKILDFQKAVQGIALVLSK